MTISEVYASASSTVKNKILAGIMQKGISYSAAWNWCTGCRAPKKITRSVVVAVINKETGGHYTEEELWPE